MSGVNPSSGAERPSQERPQSGSTDQSPQQAPQLLPLDTSRDAHSLMETLAQPRTELQIAGDKVRHALRSAGSVPRLPIDELRDEVLRKQGNTDALSLTRDDWRGQEIARRALTDYQPTIGNLPIVLLGAGHIPAFQRSAARNGFSTELTGAVTTDYLTQTDIEDAALREEIQLTMSKRIIQRANHYQSDSLTEEGYPMLLVGDFHGEEYPTHFPTAEALQAAGISSIDLMAEDVDPNLPPDEVLENMSTRTWGNRHLREYALALQQAGITVSARGINTGVHMS